MQRDARQARGPVLHLPVKTCLQSFPLNSARGELRAVLPHMLGMALALLGMCGFLMSFTSNCPKHMVP